MLHFSCDLCGQQLGDQRYVAKLEVFPAFDPDAIEEEDLDGDHLQEIAQSLQEMEENGQHEIDDCESKEFRFDLCPACQRKYVRDPLGREALTRLNFFSDN